MKNLQMLEMMLKMKNPQMYNQYMNYRNSGKSPDQVINELLQTGTINQDMLNKAKEMAQGNDFSITGNSNNGGSILKF